YGLLDERVVSLRPDRSDTVLYAALEMIRRVLGGMLAPDPGRLAALLEEWLRFYGPLRTGRVAAMLGVDGDRLRRALALLEEKKVVVRGLLTEGASQEEVCDRRNLEILLRRASRRRGQAIRPLDPGLLPRFLAAYQGLVGNLGGPKGGAAAAVGSVSGSEDNALRGCLEQLMGFPAYAEAWEEEILPARVPGYDPRDLDELMRESDLVWFGCGRGRISFCFREDVDLFREGGGLSDGPGNRDTGTGVPGCGAGEGPPLEALFPDPRGRYSFGDLQEHTGMPEAALAQRLWDLAWGGLVTSDRFETVRWGIEGGFGAPAARAGAPRRPAGSRFSAPRRADRWRSRHPGAWYVLRGGAVCASTGPRHAGSPGRGTLDPVERDDLDRERARRLLERYGVLFRELTVQECPSLGWGRLFRALRLMELSGEVVGGRFFSGIPGMQFASHRALRMLREPLPGGMFWMGAADPASLCGVGTGDLALPRRVPGTHLVFQDGCPVLVSRRRGEELEIRVEPGDPLAGSCLALFGELTGRKVRPLRAVRVLRINGEPATESPYAAVLQELGFTKGYRRLIMRGSYR
ncbi:MAG: Lhr family helicase, partial [Spirochaetota bacterium]